MMTAELAIYKSGMTFPRGLRILQVCIDATARALNLCARSKEPRSGKVLGEYYLAGSACRSHGELPYVVGVNSPQSDGELSL